MPPKSKKPAPAPPLDDIDLSAALPQCPPPPEPKRGRGRPRINRPQPPRKYKVRKDKGVKRKPQPPDPSQFPYIDNNNILVNNDVIERDYVNKSDDMGKGELQSAKDLKAKMTPKELRFIGFYLAENMSKIKAIKSAGYQAANDSYLYLLAKKIIEKYESQAQDHRIIARAIGAGEVFIIKTLYLLAKDSKSEKMRREAAMDLAKILGLTKDQVDGAGGITIIFEAPDQPGQPAALALPPPGDEQPKPATYQQPVRVLQITK